MAEKIVVCCRMPPEGIRGPLSGTYLTRARALTQRAEALGATLAAWSALTLAFAFDVDGLEEAIDLAIALSTGTADAASAWASGIAQGELEALAETGARADLAWGIPLVQALALSRMAKVGEVLLHTSLTAAGDGTLNTVGAHDDHDIGFEARGLKLDCKSPWAKRPSSGGAPRKPPPLPPRAHSSASMRAAAPVTATPPPAPVAATPPPVPPAPKAPAAESSHKPSVPRVVAAPPLPTSAAPSNPRSTGVVPVVPSARSTGPIPPGVVVVPPEPAKVSTAPNGEAPRARSLSSIPPNRYPTLSTLDVDEVDPEALAARMMQLSRDALLGGDAQALERWSEGLKATGENDGFAERMRAIARLSRGKVGDALRALETARRSAEGAPAAKRCQASLALAVGLAFAGRSDEALLEAMDALARAREGGDAKAEGACLAFLAKLYRSVDRPDEAKRLSQPPPPRE